MDLITLSIVLSMVYFISMIILLFLAIINPNEKGILTWAVSVFIAMFGFMMLYVSSEIQNVHITLHVAATLFSCILLFIGVLQYRGFIKKIDDPSLVTLMLIIIILSFYVADKPALRHALRDGLIIVLSMLSAFFMVYRTQGKERWIHALTAIGFILILPFFAFRWYLSVTGAFDMVFVGITSDSITKYIFLVAIPWTIIYTFGFGLSINYKVTRHLKKLTYHDYLTGLRNRRSMDEVFQKFFEMSTKHAFLFHVVMIDLNHFKAINDKYGHSIGDQVLSFVASAIKKQLSPLDSAYRLGGDEFVVIIHQDSPLTVHHFKERLMETFILGYQFQNQVIQIDYSIGVATFPTDGQSVDDLIRVADHNMYIDKHALKTRYE